MRKLLRAAVIASLTLFGASAAAQDVPKLNALSPFDLKSPVHPRQFGQAKAVETIRGWYIWRSWNADTWEATVTKDPPGEEYRVRVLPWATTYRHLAYGARPDDLLPGERVNLFFAADERHPRGYLVHFQDELCQMKGHNHVWEIRMVGKDGQSFVAQAMMGAKPAEEQERKFYVDPKCVQWRQGKVADKIVVRNGDRVYMTWCLQDKNRFANRFVMVLADEASLDALKKQQQEKVNALVAKEGLAGMIDAVADRRVEFMVFATAWAQANQLKAGQPVGLSRTGKGYRPTGDPIPAKLVSQKNKGIYGSGVTDLALELQRPEDAATVMQWDKKDVMRLIPRKID